MTPCSRSGWDHTPGLGGRVAGTHLHRGPCEVLPLVGTRHQSPVQGHRDSLPSRWDSPGVIQHTCVNRNPPGVHVIWGMAGNLALKGGGTGQGKALRCKQLTPPLPCLAPDVCLGTAPPLPWSRRPHPQTCYWWPGVSGGLTSLPPPARPSPGGSVTDTHAVTTWGPWLTQF